MLLSSFTHKINIKKSKRRNVGNELARDAVFQDEFLSIQSFLKKTLMVNDFVKLLNDLLRFLNLVYVSYGSTRIMPQRIQLLK